MSQAKVPDEVGGLEVFAVCPEDRFSLLSLGDGMKSLAGGEVQPFRSLAVCVDSQDSGGVFVFKCGANWQTLADDWYISLEEALGGIESQYPGILHNLVRHGNDA